jgi:large subunit ribosomal protein L28
MSQICQITGKSVVGGHNVSHSKRRTKRKFYPNLFEKKFFMPSSNEWITLKVSAAGIRNINKVGIEAALQSAIEKGFIYYK